MFVFFCSTLFAMACLVDFDACFPNHSFDWPAIVIFYSSRAFFHLKSVSYVLFWSLKNFTFLAPNEKFGLKKSSLKKVELTLPWSPGSASEPGYRTMRLDWDIVFKPNTRHTDCDQHCTASQIETSICTRRTKLISWSDNNNVCGDNQSLCADHRWMPSN